MALHFFTTSPVDKSIRAMTGTNSIVLPDGWLARELKERIQGVTPNALETAYRSWLEDNPLPQILPEEIHHYRILWRCREAQWQRVTQVLYGVAFCQYHAGSRAFRRVADGDLWSKVPLAGVHVDVIRHFRRHARFHTYAYPRLEAHWAQSDPEPPDAALHERDTVNQWKRFRNRPLTGQQLTDELNAASAKYGGSGTRRQMTDLLRYCARLRPNLALHFARQAGSRPGMIIESLRAPFSSFVGRNRDSAVLPKVICGSVTIDPIGFVALEAEPSHLDPSFERKEGKAFSDLLWYILARVPASQTLLDAGLSLQQVDTYFGRLRAFYTAWRPAIAGSLRILKDIDETIAHEVHEKRRGVRPLNAGDNDGDQAALGLNLFHELVRRWYDDIRSDVETFSRAVNCGYMRI